VLLSSKVHIMTLYTSYKLTKAFFVFQINVTPKGTLFQMFIEMDFGLDWLVYMSGKPPTANIDWRNK